MEMVFLDHSASYSHYPSSKFLIYTHSITQALSFAHWTHMKVLTSKRRYTRFKKRGRPSCEDKTPSSVSEMRGVRVVNAL